MLASDLRLIAGALDHYVNDNPGNSSDAEIRRLRELAAYYWGEATEAERKIEWVAEQGE